MESLFVYPSYPSGTLCVARSLQTQTAMFESVGFRCVHPSDDSMSGFQLWHNIDTIFWKYRDIHIFKMVSM